jgi:simple sugar transport system substrate-binding protein
MPWRKEAVRRFELGEGDRAFVWGLLSQPTRGERTQGVIDALEEAGVTVDYQEIDPATNADPWPARRPSRATLPRTPTSSW